MSSAPFGVPVVPDVYRITAVSSPARSTIRRGVDPGEERRKLAGLTSDALGSGLGGAGLRRLGETVPREDDLRLGIAEVEGNFALLEQDVHRHHDRTRACRIP